MNGWQMQCDGWFVRLGHPLFSPPPPNFCDLFAWTSRMVNLQLSAWAQLTGKELWSDPGARKKVPFVLATICSTFDVDVMASDNLLHV